MRIIFEAAKYTRDTQETDLMTRNEDTKRRDHRSKWPKESSRLAEKEGKHQKSGQKEMPVYLFLFPVQLCVRILFACKEINHLRSILQIPSFFQNIQDLEYKRYKRRKLRRLKMSETASEKEEEDAVFLTKHILLCSQSIVVESCVLVNFFPLLSYCFYAVTQSMEAVTHFHPEKKTKKKTEDKSFRFSCKNSLLLQRHSEAINPMLERDCQSWEQQYSRVYLYGSISIRGIFFLSPTIRISIWIKRISQ